MPFPILTALSVTAGLGLLQYQKQKSKPVPLMARLTSRGDGAQQIAPLHIVPQTQDEPLSTTQHLAISAGVLGMNTVAVLGFPWLRLLSLPGLVYINVHFLRLAYRSWQRTRQVTIAINDAVLANLLLLTGQLNAGALFATFFFVSQKLQQTTNKQLSHLVRPSTAAGSSSADNVGEANPQWQQSIDQGALPMLALSVVTVPFLGVQRSAGVLLANFGYDYRVLAPLTSLSYLQIAAEQGIFVRDEQIFDRLRAVDLILVDACLDDLATSLREAAAERYTVQQAPATVDALLAEIKQQQAQGRRVAFITAQTVDVVDDAWADVLVCCVETAGLSADTTPDAHVVLSPGTPAQVQQLLALTHACQDKHKQNFALALTPSLINLWGIFFMRFSPVTALIVDYGGMGLGILNAMWPRLEANLKPNHSGM